MIQINCNEKRLTEIIENAVNNAFAAQKPAPPSLHPEREYLTSEVELARFLGCSYSTAKRLKQSGNIKFTQEGTRVKFYIPDVIDAINNDNKVGALVSKMWEKLFNQNATEKNTTKPKVIIEAELHGRFMFIGLRYQGWRCTACCSSELWDKQHEVRDLVNQIILTQNNRKPFKTSPL
jgi:hypothetical protein